jgi:hypothetical protein
MPDGQKFSHFCKGMSEIHRPRKLYTHEHFCQRRHPRHTLPLQLIHEKSGVGCVGNVLKISVVPTQRILRHDQNAESPDWPSFHIQMFFHTPKKFA